VPTRKVVGVHGVCLAARPRVQAVATGENVGSPPCVPPPGDGAVGLQCRDSPDRTRTPARRVNSELPGIDRDHCSVPSGSNPRTVVSRRSSPRETTVTSPTAVIARASSASPVCHCSVPSKPTPVTASAVATAIVSVPTVTLDAVERGRPPLFAAGRVDAVEGGLERFVGRVVGVLRFEELQPSREDGAVVHAVDRELSFASERPPFVSRRGVQGVEGRPLGGLRAPVDAVDRSVGHEGRPTRRGGRPGIRGSCRWPRRRRTAASLPSLLRAGSRRLPTGRPRRSASGRVCPGQCRYRGRAKIPSPASTPVPMRGVHPSRSSGRTPSQSPSFR